MSGASSKDGQLSPDFRPMGGVNQAAAVLENSFLSIHSVNGAAM
jgi:hypothetical protein